MTFEDPLKLKIDLVETSEDEKVHDGQSSNSLNESLDRQAQDIQDATSAQPDTLAVPEGENSTAPDQAQKKSPAAPTVDSLTPWKKRRSAKQLTGSNSASSKQSSAGFKALINSNFAAWTLCISAVLFILAPNIPIFVAGFIIYPMFAAQLLSTISSVRTSKKPSSFLPAILPLIATNTCLTWGILLAIVAFVVSFFFGLISALKPSIGDHSYRLAMAVLAFCGAGFIQILLIALILACMMLFQKLFSWIAKRTLEEHGTDFGQNKAGTIGLVVGAIIGLSGLHISLATAGLDFIRPTLNISFLVWSTGITIASWFLKEIAKARHEPQK